MVNPSDTTQKTLIKRGSVDTVSISSVEITTGAIDTTESCISMKQKTNFADPLQGATLNRDTATEVLIFYPNVQFYGSGLMFSNTSLYYL